MLRNFIRVVGNPVPGSSYSCGSGQAGNAPNICRIFSAQLPANSASAKSTFKGDDILRKKFCSEGTLQGFFFYYGFFDHNLLRFILRIRIKIFKMHGNIYNTCERNFHLLRQFFNTIYSTLGLRKKDIVTREI